MRLRTFLNLAIAVGTFHLINIQLVAAQTIRVPLPSTEPPAQTSPSTPPRQINPAQPQPELAPNSQLTPPLEGEIAQCASNEFASVFSDVPPEHWAFEAVNRLAIGEFRCFPIR
ncbi:hypothetical protein H6G00_11275 [Leptolyngbya sp. FACHB-541]|uniref:hypothetical protein n=1 Tax=Leptolyngbya sp. FACHB-541 TaxID=2692810 RepID=UPI001689A8FF|nr:hypothetical protein [Leptolyngbya sp. FACHB-541]MBD1997200.1 hypothetical protein [Leptolyngbya sp. FACHB-541]